MPAIILGIPGAGKTTLAHELQRIDNDVNYISLGEVSRNLDPESSQRQELDRLFAVGRPVGRPDLFLEILEPHIDKALSLTGGFILDGMPKKVSEIEPLLDFLYEKQALPQLIIACNLDPTIAFERVHERGGRKGDEDTPAIFLHRTKTYLRGMDDFRSELQTSEETISITAHTSHHTPEDLAFAISGRFTSEYDKRVVDTLYESLVDGNRGLCTRVYGSLFDDTLNNVDHSVLVDENIKLSAKLAMVETAFMEHMPKLEETPLFLSRLAQNYMQTTIVGIKHLVDSLEQETSFEPFLSRNNVEKILDQQLAAKKLLSETFERVVEGRSLEELTSKEVEDNRVELAHLNLIFGRELNKPDSLGMSSFEALMQLQPQLWSQLTSNSIIFAPDVNYRHMSNGLPDSHHSLLPLYQNQFKMAANSMGNYMPFIEAVSANQYAGYSSSFGFLHVNGFDGEGKAFGVEYPLMTYDRQLLDNLTESGIEALRTADSIYFNHDLLHNLLPVYSHSFILHHPDAPISYGGRTEAYDEFGANLRIKKEEYELGLMISHSLTQKELLNRNPNLQVELLESMCKIFDLVSKMEYEMSSNVTEDEVNRARDFIVTRSLSNLYHIVDESHPLFKNVEMIIDSLNMPAKNLSKQEVAKLFIDQGLVSNIRITDELNLHGNSAENAQVVLSSEELSMAVIRLGLDEVDADSEVGVEYLVHKLDSWGVFSAFSSGNSFSMSPVQNAIWYTVIAPQRKQLRGYMVKAHAGHEVTFGDDTFKDPRELIFKQRSAIAADRAEYQRRTHAREMNQKVSFMVYSLIFDDGQSMCRVARHQFDKLRSSLDVGERLFAKEAVGELDRLMHHLVNNDYVSMNEGREVSYLSSYLESLKRKTLLDTKELTETLLVIVEHCNILSRHESLHQSKTGKSYSEESKRLEESTMNIA